MSKKYFLFFLLFSVSLSFLPSSVLAAGLASKLAGKILLNVEMNGEAWYVYPENNKRYYLGRPADAFAVMRELGLGISEENFVKIATASSTENGDEALAKRLAGKIVLQTEKNGEAWYINPVNLRKYYLGRPADAFAIMRELGLGISRKDLALIHKIGETEKIDEYSKYEYKKVETEAGIFTVNEVEIDLSDPDLEIITDTANAEDCKTNCPAKTLADFVVQNNAFAAMNGTYFDTSAGKKNYYFAPVFNKNIDKLINKDQLRYWTTGPMIVFDENNKFYYFKDSREFVSVEDFEKKNSVKIQAAISNRPRLVENGLDYLIGWSMDDKQAGEKLIRNVIGYKDNKVYLLAVNKATLPELVRVVKALGYEYALNMDGGYSAAIYYNDEYMIGPGRNIPNAILFAKKKK